MERKLKEVKLDSAKTFSELYGLKDQSPLIGVIDFKTAQKSPNNLEMEYGVYALYLKDVSVSSLKYGAYPCDYTSGTFVNFQRFPTLDAKKLVNAPKMSAHHRGICHF